jgi:uncharacterized protein YndB with AHSA1/START domain
MQQGTIGSSGQEADGMKMNFDIQIDADIDRVWTAFTDPDNMRRWVQNFKSFTPTSGEPGQPGATAEIVFDEKGKEVTLKETVTERREKSFLAATFEMPHGTSQIVNHFEVVDAKTTRWTSWCKFSFTGLMNVLSVFMAGTIRKRTEGDMNRFKLMVESDIANDK